MDNSPWMPANASIQFWLSVLGCFIFWLAAYALIIRRGFADKTFGMPIAALCGNIAWETLFSNVFIPDYRLVRIGNSSWVFFDLAILFTALKFGPQDFISPLIKRFLRPLIFLGIGFAIFLSVPFAKVYQDTQGYFLGWAAAFMMSILFPAMLIRRDSVRGQSVYIALAMFFGNLSAFFWVKYYPRVVLDPSINLSFMIATGFFNLVYVVLIYRKCLQENINPLRRF